VYSRQIEEALKASSNRTVNLLHEPSAGGTTLGRRLAWEFMERYPVVLLDQISSDTASYLRDIFQFSSLPVLVLMEGSTVTESEREGLLKQLREDNIGDLRALTSRYEDATLRRALCSAIVSRAKHNWNSISQGDLQTVVLMMERNIHQQGARDTDVRRWLSAYRRLRTFDVQIAIERLLDWHNLNAKSIDPIFYLYVFYFLRWLTAPAPREGLAVQVNEWLRKCQASRPFGERGWSYEWLRPDGKRYAIAHFSDLGFDPAVLIRAVDHPDRKKLNTQLARVEGIMRDYRGPQNATLDLGQSVMARITPLDKLSRDDEGRRISALLSFSYDGLVGWDPMRIDKK